MNANELRHPIVIEKLTSGFDEIGNQTESWATFHPCRAAINGVSGREYMAAKAEQAESTLTFRIRYCAALKDLTPQSYRINWGGKVFDIEHIDNYKFLNESLNIKAVLHG
jgi:SPP1 family predicted phage head-tail adaptor